jgi:hypothetical protein
MINSRNGNDIGHDHYYIPKTYPNQVVLILATSWKANDSWFSSYYFPTYFGFSNLPPLKDRHIFT